MSKPFFPGSWVLSPESKRQFQRILLIRLDRIGDVLLSTPALEAVRAAHPTAHLAMLVRPPCDQLLESHPALNQVLVYEKDGAHRGWGATLAFAWRLRRERFDTALILHPSLRSHIIAAVAGIPVRIGWDRDGGWLLTRRVPHVKQEGRQHELDYTLEVVRAAGIPVDGVRRLPTMACTERAVTSVKQWLAQQGVQAGESLIACHPSASGPEKRWPAKAFAELADRLINQMHARIVLVAGPEGRADCDAVARAMRAAPLRADGVFDLQQLAALLKRVRLLISNDSGPVHVAVSQGTPVIALFGRTQPGVNPERWKPLGPRDVVLCREPITALAPDEVYEAVAALLQGAQR